MMVDCDGYLRKGYSKDLGPMAESGMRFGINMTGDKRRNIEYTNM
jgi:hypothetical protein